MLGTVVMTDTGASQQFKTYYRISFALYYPMTMVQQLLLATLILGH